MNPGDRIGRFSLVRMIRSEGDSAYYEARHEELGVTVVLRTLERRTAESLDAFFLEAKTIAEKRTRPHILDVGITDDGVAYMVLESISI